MVRIQNLLAKYSFDIVKIVQSKNRSMRSQSLMFVLAIKSEKTDGAMARDEISELNLRNYSQQCAEIERDIKKIIHDKLSGGDKVDSVGHWHSYTTASRFRPGFFEDTLFCRLKCERYRKET